MNKKVSSSRFQKAIDVVESLPKDDQVLLIEILRHRFIQHRRSMLENEVLETRNAYERGDIHRGTVDDLMREIED